MDRHKADCCKCHKQVQPAQQTITDMEFDRGIWNAGWWCCFFFSYTTCLEILLVHFFTVIYNEVDRVRSFIQKGKTMDLDNCDYTALHYAARNGNEEICKLLINEGKADVNAVTKGGVTPLHRAAMMGMFT